MIEPTDWDIRNECRAPAEVRDVLAEALALAANNLGALAMAINRLAATQEHPLHVMEKKPLSWGVAQYAEKPDIQTQELRELEARRRSGFDSQTPKTPDRYTETE